MEFKEWSIGCRSSVRERKKFPAKAQRREEAQIVGALHCSGNRMQETKRNRPRLFAPTTAASPAAFAVSSLIALPTEFELGGSTFWKGQGVPGTDHANVVAADLSTFRQTLDGRVARDRFASWPALSARPA